MIYSQGDIVEVSFDPSLGHEAKKRRPALVVGSIDFNKATSMTLVCPITTIDNSFFLHEPLPNSCETKGFVAMEQVRALDLDARKAVFVERLSVKDRRSISVCLASFFAVDND